MERKKKTVINLSRAGRERQREQKRGCGGILASAESGGGVVSTHKSDAVNLKC